MVSTLDSAGRRQRRCELGKRTAKPEPSGVLEPSVKTQTLSEWIGKWSRKQERRRDGGVADLGRSGKTEEQTKRGGVIQGGVDGTQKGRGCKVGKGEWERRDCIRRSKGEGK